MTLQHLSSRTLALAIASVLAPAAMAEQAGDAWVKRIDKRVERMRPTADETKFNLVGWAPGLRDAIAAAKASKRPVFLFTSEGYINTGRC